MPVRGQSGFAGNDRVTDDPRNIDENECTSYSSVR